MQLKAFAKRSANVFLAPLDLELRRKSTGEHGAAESQQRTLVNAWYRGGCLRCYQEDVIGQFILTGIGWDNQLTEVLDALDDRSGDVIEIGANIGASIIPVAKAYPALTFHCLEPVPEFFQLLKENLNNYQPGNVQIYQHACAASEGQALQLHVQGGTAGALPSYDGHAYQGSHNVVAGTLDGFAADKVVRLIKLDVDGYEASVLQGAERTIKRDKPLLFMEFHATLLRQAGTDPQELLNKLQSFGYTAARAWDNVGNHILDTTSFKTLYETALAARYYIDVLFSAEPFET